VPTTIPGLAGQSTTEPGDFIVIQNTAANRTRKISYNDFKNELAADMDVVTTTALTSALAGITTAYQAADNALKQQLFPVGTRLVMVGVNALTNPNSYLGFGTWVKEEGYYYASHKAGDSDFGTVGAFIGSKIHSHGGFAGGTTLNINQIPSHAHVTPYVTFREQGNDGTSIASGEGILQEGAGNLISTFSGGSQSHNHTISADSNLPPSIVEVSWRRTA
jgi:hypothetical protein